MVLIYIYIYVCVCVCDGSQYKDIFLYEIFDDKILMSYKL